MDRYSIFLNMSVLYLNYRFITTPIKSKALNDVGISKLILKFIWRCLSPSTFNKIFEKKPKKHQKTDKTGFITYSKTIVTKLTNIGEGEGEGIRSPKIGPQGEKKNQLTFDTVETARKGTKNGVFNKYDWANQIFIFQKGIRKQTLQLSQKQLRMDYRCKCKT